MTPDVEVVDVTFTKSVIHSRAAMTYQDAQELIDGVAGSEVEKKIEKAPADENAAEYNADTDDEGDE